MIININTNVLFNSWLKLDFFKPLFDVTLKNNKVRRVSCVLIIFIIKFYI